MRDNGYFADGTHFRIAMRGGRWSVITWEYDDSPDVVVFAGSYEDCMEYANAPERNIRETW